MDALHIISDEHRNLWRLTVTMDQLAEDLESGQAVDAPFFTVLFDYVASFVDGIHHPKEEGVLFQRLRARDPGADALLERLEADHRGGPDKLAALRAQLADLDAGKAPAAVFAGGLRAYAAGLKEHIRVEERDLFPRAKEAFSDADWAEIDAAFTNDEDPLFGEKAQAEHRELHHRIVSLAPEHIGLGASRVGALDPEAATAPGGDALLSIRGLESAYGRIKALRGVDIEVRKGELVALVGANGAGKTTLLRTISGVQPASAGEIRFDGENITRLRADLRVRRGVLQSPEGRQVFGPLSVEDNLRLGGRLQPKQQSAQDLERIWEMFPILKEKRLLAAGGLSGGQQQMLAIGRALMGRPKLLLLDEPSMGLAPLLVEEVFNVIRALKAQGMTILLVEQNAVAALSIADRGYVMETGAITLTGPGRTLLEDEQVQAAYLGM